MHWRIQQGHEQTWGFPRRAGQAMPICPLRNRTYWFLKT